MKIILKMYCGRGVDADGEIRVEVSWKLVGALQRNGGEGEDSTRPKIECICMLEINFLRGEKCKLNPSNLLHS